VKLFLSYRHVPFDRRVSERLAIHLASAADEIQTWVDNGIELGDEWKREIERAIETSDVGVVLISADFLVSPFIRNVELPMLVEAQREGRLRLIPLYVAPGAVVPDGIKGLQGPNAPAKPLSALTNMQREVVYADFVKLLHEQAASTRVRSGADDQRGSGGDINLERAPAGGLLFDRAEIRREIAEFLSRPQQRICVVHGFHGVGKTTLAAKVVEDQREPFVDVFWVTGRRSERSGLMLLARLDAFLRRNHDDSLRGFMRHRAEPEVDLDEAITRAVAGLTRVRYLLVFDDFQAYLNSANALADDIIRRLLHKLSLAAGGTKVLLLANRRPTLEQGFNLFPTGSALEQELVGLPVHAVGELIADCGLDISDADLLGGITTHFSGNPAMIKVYCSFVVRQHRDPTEALRAVSIRGPFADVVEAAVADLEPGGLDALARLAVLRAPLDWDHLEGFGLSTAHVVSLLDRYLVALDPSSHTVAMPPVIRQFALDSTDPPLLRAAHLRAAEGYERGKHPVDPRSYEDVRPLIEAGHHRIEAGDADAGATAILDAVEYLVRWGYGDLATDEIGVVEAHTSNPAVLARCHLQSGRILDRRGLLGQAEQSYQSAVRLARDVGDDLTLAHALFRLGRIQNARNDYPEAERLLIECIALCTAAGLGRPKGAALLALTWGRKEGGAAIEGVVDAFEEALALAEAHGDHATASDAHRQLGFIRWVTFRDRPGCEQHYDEALRIATTHSLVKEIGAIHKELAYLYGEWRDLDAADRHVRLGIEAAEGLRDQYLLPGAYTNEGLVLQRRGDFDGAHDLLQRAVREFAENGNAGGEAYALYELARLEADRGRRPEALEHLGRARQLCVDHGLTLQLKAIESTAKVITDVAAN
jgi:tetratricopeptide (TPR) repeat protein